GFNFTLNTPDGPFQINSPFIGYFNIQNLMCAVISEWLQGYRLKRIADAVSAMEPVEGRLEVLDPHLPVDIIIDFAHTPDALEKIIDTIEPFVTGRMIFLVGMTGERDMSKAAEMGRISTRADYAIFTPDNPANDDPATLVRALEQGAVHENHRSFIDRAEGIQHAIDISRPGDTIVLACKGREPYQIMEDYIKVPHRDDLIALDAAYRKYRSEEYDYDGDCCRGPHRHSLYIRYRIGARHQHPVHQVQHGTGPQSPGRRDGRRNHRPSLPHHGRARMHRNRPQDHGSNR